MKRNAFMMISLILVFQVSLIYSQAVKIEGGLVEGVVEDGMRIYRGIPFAAPPLGDLRWHAPDPVKPWKGVLRADHFAPACPQMKMNFPGAPKTETSEDCLYLNIWSPAVSEKDKLPVMVWIYGGGFALGATSAPLYSGEEFAKKKVVFVSIAYRVGPLGFMAHPELSAESENHVSGNYGLLDQIAGLKWVKQNIKAFGGDPGNVTIFGESAGAISVSMLAASPLTKGLFHRAISESGGSFGPVRLERVSDCMQVLKGAEMAGLEFAERMGAKSVDELRKMDPEKWADDPGAQMGGFWPVVDGYVIAADQYDLYKAGTYNDVPVMIGTNSDEGSFFVRPMKASQFIVEVGQRFGPLSNLALKHYPAGEDSTVAKSNSFIFRETVFAWPTWTWARLQTKTGKSKVFMYYFDQPQPAGGFFPSLYKVTGSPHGSEMAYVFKHLGQNPTSKFTEEDKALSEIMSDYWVNFAKYGDPNGKGLPVWPVFKENEATVMYVKGEVPHPGPVPNFDKLEFMDEYFTWLRKPVSGGK